MGDVKLGRLCRLYINLGTYVTPNWSPVNILQNGTLTQTVDDVAFDTRGSKVKKHDQALLEVGYSFNIPATTVPDSNFLKLLKSFTGGLKLDMAIMDNAITTLYSRGPRGYFLVMKFDRAEEINGHVNYTIEIKPAHDATYDLREYCCLPKATNSGSAIADNTDVYWDSTSKIVTETVGTNTYLGKTVGAVADGASYVYVDTTADVG